MLLLMLHLLLEMMSIEVVEGSNREMNIGNRMAMILMILLLLMLLLMMLLLLLSPLKYWLVV